MTREMVNYLKGNTMLKLYNLGCSFAYGNCVPTRNVIGNEHKGPGTFLAQYLNRSEVNLARNGNSIDGILRRLYTHKFDKNGIILIGVPPAGRFQVVSKIEQRYNKERATKASVFGKTTPAQNCIKYAYTKGPETRGDYFHTLKWPDFISEKLNETAKYHVLFTILKIQTKLKELGLEYYIYNSVSPLGVPKNEETISIKEQIDWSNYYKPEESMFDIVKSNSDYELAEGDQHPNHLAYEIWFRGFVDWLKNK